MRDGEELEKLLSVMARLRGPDGCPWDREQTMRSLRPFVLEEAYELVDAIANGTTKTIQEELGDLLLEVVFVTQIAKESGLFTMADVARGIREKLVRRHPHVFETKGGRLPATTPDEALGRWEDIKASEKPGRSSALDDIPRALPALAKAAKIAKRAANVGFDWRAANDVVDKIQEELDELRSALAKGDNAAVHEEMGDLLFAVVNLARHASDDAELALSDASDKFSKRFRYMETKLKAQSRSITESSMDELEALWQEAKLETS